MAREMGSANPLAPGCMIERLDRFMARANAIYYATHDPFADFTTAPEISQVFGELLGLWCGVVWRMIGSPRSLILAEAGPGQGHLMCDALRAAGRALPDFMRAVSVHLIETSPRLITKLTKALPMATIHADISELPDGPVIMLANEFLDVLPVRQFVRHDDCWVERYVEGNNFVEYPTEADLPDAVAGSIRELSDASDTFISALAKRVANQGGAALLIDYGTTTGQYGDTLQAISAGVPVHSLQQAGTADLTCHVDFDRVGTVARHAGCTVSGPVEQGAFLAVLGIHERTAQLGKSASPMDAIKLLAATRRLTAAEAMGSLFKVIGISQQGLVPLPGFAA